MIEDHSGLQTMKITMRKVLLAGAALVAMTTASTAADIMMSAPAPTAPPPPAPSFNWSGPYAGLIGLYYNEGGSVFGLGAAAGYNFTNGGWLFGLEGRALGLAYAPISYNFVGLARAGYMVGDALIYGAVGGGYFNNFAGAAGLYLNVGGGVEVAVGESVSVRLEGMGYRYGVGAWGIHAGLGVNWHFGD